MTIYKYPLKFSAGVVRLELPMGAQVLTVQTQGAAICLWAVVDAESKDFEERVFELYGTGHPMSKAPRRYLGTVQLPAFGPLTLVWHVFEVLPS